MKCLKCQHENKLEAKFCSNCGIKLQSICLQSGVDGLPRRGSTPRTHRLAWDAATSRSGNFVERERLYREYKPDKSLSPMMANASCFAHVHPRQTPLIRDGELIAGARIQADEEPGWGWVPDGNPDYVSRFASNSPPHRPDIRKMAERGLLSPAGSFNHKVVDYKGFIRTGAAAIAARARQIANQRKGKDREFAIAYAIGHEAIIAYAAAYVKECEALARTSTPERARELREIAQICSKVPAQPASTFREAIQSFWFAYMVAGDGTGRPDVFLNDFYRADLAAGRITPEQALELIECLMIKLHGEYASSKFNVSSIHTMTLGGQLPDGSDATNELTRLFLQAIRNVRLLRPTVYIRCHEKTPEDVLELAVTMLGEGLAEPNFYGDEPIVAGLIRNGFTPEIARDYALSGCTEVVTPGTGNQGAVSGWINLALLADDALRECATVPNPDSECLWRIIERRAEELAEMCRVTNCWLDDRDKDVRYQSTILMPVCLEKCKDVVHGGADSYIGQWEGMGLPNAADMVYAAESLVFDQGDENLCSLFEGLDWHNPAVLARLRSLPKFGNDHAGVDAIGARLIRLVADALEKRSTPVRSSLTLGHLAGGENMHLAYGMVMGATLDGRAKGQTLADSLAGSQGYTTSGPTAVIRSVCSLDHSRLCAGNITTLRFSTTEFATPESRAKVVSLIRAFVAMGGSQLQINVADAEVMREAQKNPAAHSGLLVRVAGYSADFTGIGKTLQDEIIARTEGLADISPSSLSKNL